MTSPRDREKARMSWVFIRNILYFPLAGLALTLVIWSFLAKVETEVGPCGEHTTGPLFPWGVAKSWRWGADRC